MRIHITLIPLQLTPQPLNHHHIQGAIYSIFKSTGNKDIHTSPRYKFFCFSNLFPFIAGVPFSPGKPLHFFISSPNSELIHDLHNFFSFKPELSIGDYVFKTHSSKIIRSQLPLEGTLIAGTPIVCSIPKKLYTKYGIQSERELIYWTNQFSLNAFVDLVTHNLVRKYNRFYDTQIDEDMILFRKFKFNAFAVIPYKKGEVAASYWELPLDITNSVTKDILQFGLDCGFGEKNSAGFGFMNIKRNK